MKKWTHKHGSKEHLYARDREAVHMHSSAALCTCSHIPRPDYTQHTHTWTHTLFNAPGTSHASHFVLCRPCSKETNRSSEPTLKDNFCELIISCIWPITHICGQHRGRGRDRREDWRALIPASCGRCYCSGASQMSTTWLILCWLTRSFLPTNPQMCSTNNSSRGSRAVSSRRLTSVRQNREQWMSRGWVWVLGPDYLPNISAEYICFCTKYWVHTHRERVR